MGIEVTWDNLERTILRLDFDSGWSASTFEEAMRYAWDLINKSNHKVDVVMNLTEQCNLADGTVMRFQGMLASAPAGLGFVVIACRVHSIENAFGLLNHINPMIGGRLVFVPTVEGARSALAHPYTLNTVVSPARVNNS
jgi:hypothetical protein